MRVIPMARYLQFMQILLLGICLAMMMPWICRAADSGPFSFNVLSTEKLTMRFTHQDGIRQNTTAFSPPSKGASLSTQSAIIQSQVVREKLTFRAELSQSMLNDRDCEMRMDSKDKAWKAQFLGRDGRFSWAASTKHMGPAYMTFANPLRGTPRSRYDFDSTIDLGPSVLSLSALRKRDYLDSNELNPVVETSTGTIRYTYARLPGAAKLLTSYSCSSMEYIQSQPSDARSTSQTISLGTALAQPKWSLVPAYTYKINQQISRTEINDSDTSQVLIKGEFRPVETVSLTPQLSFSNTCRSNTGARSFTRQSALSSRLKLVPGTIDLTTTLSHLANWNQDGSIDTDSILAGGRIDCALSRRTSTPAGGSLSIGAQVRRTKDRAGDTIQNEWEARASLSIKHRTALYGNGQVPGTSYR